MSENGARGSLCDLKVIDLSRGLAGPFCTMLLADHGADVVKIEGRDGDPARELGPFLPNDSARHHGGYFQSVNRNKRSIVIDLKTEAGADVVRRLVRESDVLVENFRVGVMERLGLGYEALAALNPRLVYAAIRGFGDPRTGESPYAAWPAFDVTAQAAGGLVAITGPDADHPTRVGASVGDMIPGLFASFGLMAAVHEARQSGRGQFVDVAMYDAVFAICERSLYRHTYTGEVARPEGNDHPLVRPFGIFPAKDGAVAIAAGQGRLWPELCRIMGRTDIAQDARFVSLEVRLQNSNALNAIIATWSRERTKAELAGLLGGRVPFAPVNDAQDNLADPHIAARRMVAEVEHAGTGRKLGICDTPIKMTRTPGGVRRGAPAKGEHTDEVLNGLGLSTDAIAALRRAGAVG